MKKVYLAGPIGGLTFEEASGWRERLKVFLRGTQIEVFSPLRGKEYLKGTVIRVEEPYTYTMSTDKAIVTRDRTDVLTADLVICNLLGAKSVSIGTMFELAWANQARVPVVLVMEKQGNLHNHPFVREAADFLVETVGEAGVMALHILEA